MVVKQKSEREGLKNEEKKWMICLRLDHTTPVFLSQQMNARGEGNPLEPTFFKERNDLQKEKQK